MNDDYVIRAMWAEVEVKASVTIYARTVHDEVARMFAQAKRRVRTRYERDLREHRRAVAEREQYDADLQRLIDSIRKPAARMPAYTLIPFHRECLPSDIKDSA